VAQLNEFETLFGLSRKVNRLYELKFFSPTENTPIKLLHTVTLGCARYLFLIMKTQIVASERHDPHFYEWLTACSDSVDRHDCLSTVNVANIIE
jgi:hypothetical protein